VGGGGTFAQGDFKVASQVDIYITGELLYLSAIILQLQRPMVLFLRPCILQLHRPSSGGLIRLSGRLGSTRSKFVLSFCKAKHPETQPVLIGGLISACDSRMITLKCD
jgi:hypothetical protein